MTIRQGVYRHYKGGLYSLLMLGRCCDNGPGEGEEVIVYVSHQTGQVCTRFASQFFSKVGLKDRFEFLGQSVTTEEYG